VVAVGNNPEGVVAEDTPVAAVAADILAQEVAIVSKRNWP